MNQRIYHLLTRQPRFIKKLLFFLAKISTYFLSFITGFNPAPEVSLTNFQMFFGTWDKGVTSILEKVLKPGMIVIDVGAHVGYFARQASKLVGPNGKVYAFEPNNDNFSRLEKNSKSFKNITAIPLAVSDTEGEIEFFDSTIGSGRHSLVSSRGEHAPARKVKVVTLDSFIKNEKVDLVKIDVEGAEISVLNGMDSIIKNNPKISIIIEYYPALFVAQGLSSSSLLEELSNRGFLLYPIDDKNGRIDKPINHLQIRDFAQNFSEKYINIFATSDKIESNNF